MRRCPLLFLALVFVSLSSVHAQVTPEDVAECRDPELTPSQKATPVLSIGWTHYEAAREGAHLEVARYLSCKLRRPVRGVVLAYQARHSVAERMRPTTSPQLRIDAALLTPYVYVLAKELAPIEAFATYRSRGGESYHSLIVWRADSPYGTIDELFEALIEDPTKALACPDRNSTSGFQWPRAWLFGKRQKLLGEHVRIVETDTHDMALEQLLGRLRTDIVAAAVWDGAFSSFKKRPGVDGEMFRSHALQPPIPHDAFAYHQYLSEEEKADLRRVLLAMEADPQGKIVLEDSFPDWIDAWVEASDSDYDGVRAVSDFVSPPLRLKLQTPADYPMESLRAALFNEDGRGGWFTEGRAGQEIDLVMEVGVQQAGAGLEAAVSVLDQRTGPPASELRPAAESVEELEHRIARWVKDSFRLRGYLSEVPVPGAQGGSLILRAGSGRGISSDDVAEILTPGGDRVPARVLEVESEQVRVAPLEEKAIHADFDPSDTNYFRAEVFPRAARPLLWAAFLVPILGGLAGGLIKVSASRRLFGRGFGLPGLTGDTLDLVLGALCGAGLFAAFLALPETLAITRKLDPDAASVRLGLGVLGGLVGAAGIGGGWKLLRSAARRRGEDAAPRESLDVGVFISYRRTDTAAYAGRLRDSLSARIDPERVFMDIESIEVGTDFVDAMERALKSSDVMIVLIGKDWLMVGDEGERPRIADPEDYVRLEITAGLESDLPIVPVLVGGASMPAPGDLPEALAQLSRRNALEISDTRWDFDVGRLLDALRKIAAQD